MADASVTLEMLIKEGKAIVGLERVAAAQQKVEKGAGKIGNETKRADAELERFAKRTTQLNATPLEKFNVQMSKLEAALERGKIKHDTYTRAVFKAKEAFDQAGRSQQTMLGPSALGQITQFAGGYLTLSRAVQLVGDAFRHAKQNADGALNSLRGLDGSRQGLAQLAIGKAPGTLAGWQQRADEAAMSSGAGRDVSYKALHTMETYGQLEKYEEVMGAHPLVNAGAGAQIATKVREMTGKTHEFRPLLNMLIEAGKHSAVDAETLAGPMAIAAEGGRDIGGSAAQTASVLSVLTTYFAGRGDDAGEGKTGAARIAGDRMKTFAHKVGSRLPALAKTKPDWIGAFEAVGKMPEAEQKEFFQENQEVRAAFSAYWDSREKNKAVYRATDAAGAAPVERDNLTQGLMIRGNDPKSLAAIEINRAEILKEIANEDKNGVAAAKRKAQNYRGQAAGFQSNQGVLSQYGIAAGGETAEFFQTTPQTTVGLQAAGAMAAAGINGDMASGGRGFWNFIGRLIENQYKEAVHQTELLKDIRDQRPGGDTRAIQAAAQAPQH